LEFGISGGAGVGVVAKQLKLNCITMKALLKAFRETRDPRIVVRDVIALHASMGDHAVSNWLETNPTILETVTREEWIEAYDTYKSMMSRQTRDNVKVTRRPHENLFSLLAHLAQRTDSAVSLQHKLTREEWAKEFGNDDMFDAYDNDHDGALSPEEWLKGVQAEKKFMEADAVELSSSPAHLLLMAQGCSLPDTQRWQNHDRKISREEWIARFGNDDFFDAYGVAPVCCVGVAPTLTAASLSLSQIRITTALFLPRNSSEEVSMLPVDALLACFWFGDWFGDWWVTGWCDCRCSSDAGKFQQSRQGWR